MTPIWKNYDVRFYFHKTDKHPEDAFLNQVGMKRIMATSVREAELLAEAVQRKDEQVRLCEPLLFDFVEAVERGPV